jgi:hypothetical protein
MPSSDSLTFSILNANSKHIHNHLAVWAVPTVVFLIQERKTKQSQDYQYDIVILCSQGGFTANVPLPHEIVAIKYLIKQFYNVNVTKVILLNDFRFYYTI